MGAKKHEAKFIGGVLDGQRLPIIGARYYVHQHTDGRFHEYKRSATVYANGDHYANEANQAVLSHFEYTFVEDRGTP